MKSIFSLFFTILLNICFGQTQPSLLFARGSDNTSKILRMMEEQKTTAMSIAIYRNFGLDTVINYGHHSTNRTTPVNDQSLFNIGNMSASYAHLLILKMEEEGKINSLQDPVNNYLIDWKIPENRWSQKDPVTILDLLLHRRGFQSISKPTGYLATDVLPTVMDLLKYGIEESSNPIQLEHNINRKGNSSYVNELILQHLIESVYQDSYPNVITREVIHPLGLNNTFCFERLPENKTDQAVYGYQKDGQELPGRYPAFKVTVSSGIWTSVQDYAKYILYLFESYQGTQQNPLISQDRIIKGLTEEYAGYRRSLLLHNVGYYWGGASPGYRTQMAGDIDRGNFVVIFMNSHENWPFMADINRMVWQYIDSTL